MAEVEKIGGFDVARETDWNGIRIWAFFSPGSIELFDYIGRDIERDHYFFKRRREPEFIIGLPLSEIFSEYFKPFYLDMSKIHKPEE